MKKFLHKRKANKIKKLKTRVIELETENETLQNENEQLEIKIFKYKLQNGEIIPKIPPRPRMMKVMGNRGYSTASGGAE